jgi:hypothetical protein
MVVSFVQGWFWEENKTIENQWKNSWNHLHPLSNSPFLTCSDHVLQHLEFIFLEKNSWNQLNNWKNHPWKLYTGHWGKLFSWINQNGGFLVVTVL